MVGPPCSRPPLLANGALSQAESARHGCWSPPGGAALCVRGCLGAWVRARVRTCVRMVCMRAVCVRARARAPHTHWAGFPAGIWSVAAVAPTQRARLVKAAAPGRGPFGLALSLKFQALVEGLHILMRRETCRKLTVELPANSFFGTERHDREMRTGRTRGHGRGV